MKSIYICRPFLPNSPLGRISITTIMNTKATAPPHPPERKLVTKTSTKPRRHAPTIAPPREPIPPRMIMANPIVSAVPPMVGVAAVIGAANMPPMEASMVPMANVTTPTVFTFTPMREASSRSWETARMAHPNLVHLRSAVEERRDRDRNDDNDDVVGADCAGPYPHHVPEGGLNAQRPGPPDVRHHVGEHVGQTYTGYDGNDRRSPDPLRKKTRSRMAPPPNVRRAAMKRAGTKGTPNHSMRL